MLRRKRKSDNRYRPEQRPEQVVQRQLPSKQDGPQNVKMMRMGPLAFFPLSIFLPKGAKLATPILIA